MIDLDRVVFDCPSFIYWIGNILFTKTHLDNKLTYNLIDTEKVSGYTNLLFFIKMSHSKNYTQVDNSIEILKKWNNQGFNISFVSSRPNFKSLQKATVEWLKENDIKFDDLIFTCTNKPVFCKINNFDVMIDDTLDNCIGAKKLDVTPIWVRTKFNIDEVDFPKDIFNTSSWTEIDAFVQSLYSQNSFDSININSNEEATPTYTTSDFTVLNTNTDASEM